MRTKTLLLSAAVLAAGLISSIAQNVYSVNVVGYYKLTIPASKFGLVASQLPVNGTDNLVNDTITNGVPDGSSLLLWNGSSFTILTYFADFTVWADQDGNPATNSLKLGKAAYLQNGGGSSATVTWVGQVPQGTNAMVVTPGFDFIALPSAISTNIDNPGFGTLPATDGDSYLHWSVARRAMIRSIPISLTSPLGLTRTEIKCSRPRSLAKASVISTSVGRRTGSTISPCSNHLEKTRNT